MTRLDAVSHDKWLKKRKLTTTAFAVQNVLLGWDYGLVFINLWIYIEKVVETDKPKIYYSVILVSYMLCAFLSSVYLCKLADQYRNIRILFLVSNSALVIGNIIYMFPFSPWILLIGRVITGAGLSQRSIISGELARCYPRDQLTSKFSIMGMANSLGFVVAPIVNILFRSVDIWIGTWHVTYVNISGLYMSIIFGLAQILCIFMIFDLSKEYDLKYEVESANKSSKSSRHALNYETRMVKGAIDSQNECELNGDTANGAVYLKYGTESNTNFGASNGRHFTDATEKTFLLPEGRKLQVRWIAKELMSHYDTGILLGLGFLESFLIMSFNMCLPIIIMDILKWSVTSFNAIFLCTGIICVIPCLVLICKTFTDPVVFYISVLSIFGYALLQLIEILFTLHKQNFTFNVILCVLYCVFYANSMIIKDVLLGGFLAKMVCSQYQSLSDSIRVAFSRVGDIAALMSAPYALQKIDVVGSVYISIILVFIVLLILRKRTLRHPNIIITTNG